MYILGIESSCDDTSVAIIDSDKNILANIIISQNSEHQDYKGVVPEIAARSHFSNLQKALDQALDQAEISLKDLGLITATTGPGLIGGVIVGSTYARTLASVLKIPFLPVNHLEGHVLSAMLTEALTFPYLVLLVSGGHCQFVAVQELGKYQLLGATLDDAAGEAFDKVAKMLNLDFPGGPQIELFAQEGNENRFKLPLPMLSSGDANMSFSGLKTATRLIIEQQAQGEMDLNLQVKRDIAACFQKTACDILLKKSQIAIKLYENLLKSDNLIDHQGKKFVICGGVAANKYLRNKFAHLQELGYECVAPPAKLCTDNAAMIAFAGLLRYENDMLAKEADLKPKARWGLEEL